MTEIPALSKQVDARLIQRPAGRQYNSGMADVGGIMVLAARVYAPARNCYEIELQRLHDDGHATPIKRLALPGQEGCDHEDARLFWHDERLFCAYTEGHYMRQPFTAMQRLVELDEDFDVVREVPLRYGHNDRGRMEKNWQFFSHEGRLHFVYGFTPHTVVAIGEDGSLQAEYLSNRIAWPYGTMSGGTPPVRIGDRYLSFFHSYVRIAPRHRRYSFSAYEFEAKPPFAITRVTQPLARASAEDSTLPNEKFPDWNPLVVFPCGHVVHGDMHLVSAGVNDSHDALIRLPLDLPLVQPDELPKQFYFHTKNGSKPVRLAEGYAEWQRLKSNPLLGQNDGIMAVSDGLLAEALRSYAQEITQDDYVRLRRYVL